MLITTTLHATAPEGGTAVALGFFDGIHRGHTRVIAKAVEQARERIEQPFKRRWE